LDWLIGFESRQNEWLIIWRYMQIRMGGKGEGALAISMNTLGKFPDSKDAILL